MKRFEYIRHLANKVRIIGKIIYYTIVSNYWALRAWLEERSSKK